MTRNTCSWRESIQCWPNRRKCKRVPLLAPEDSTDHENPGSILIRASESDQALPLNAAVNAPRSPKRHPQPSLDESPLWKSLHSPAEEKAMTLQGQLEIALVPWPRSNEQFFLPADVQDRLIIAPRVAAEFERLFPNLPLAERSSYVTKTCSSARKLFAILLGIEKGDSILDLLADGITDDDLPLVKHPKRSANAVHTTPYFTLRAKRQMDRPIQTIDHWNWRTSIRQFYSEQWWLKAPVFDTLGKHYELEDDCVLPFVEDKEDINVNSGGYSDVWGVRIHPAHQKLFRSSNPQKFPVPLIAVKRLHSPLKEDFDKEQSMLNSIAQKDHPHIVKLLATYRYRSRYHLLFPWAPCNLRVYWATNPNPGWNRTSVLWMLEQLEGLTCGLHEVHNFKINKVKTALSPLQAPDPTRLLVPGTVSDISVAAEDYLYGRHGDLKPENILWSNELKGVDPMGVLQIADFGLGRFHGRASRSQMLAKSSIASPTYEPPEIPLNEKVSRAYDIWSLGCVFLEFITWRLGGKRLLGEFERLREVDGGDDTVNDKFFTVINYNKPGQDAVVRREVIVWIQILLQHPRCSGAMRELLATVQEHMLVILPKKRIECKDLRDLFVDLRRRAKVDDLFLLGNAPKTFTDVDNIQNITSPISTSTCPSRELPQVYMLDEDGQLFEKHGAPEITFERATSEGG